MTIAIDFDGTIVEHYYPHIGKEKPFAFDALKQLQKDGHKLILWTAREGVLLDEAVEFCRKNGVEFYAVNTDGPAITNYENAGITRKLRVDIFIDDRNLGGLPDWPTIYNMVSNGLKYSEIYGDDEHEEKAAEHHRKGWLNRLIHRCRYARRHFSLH